MLLDQERFGTAAKNAQALLEESRRASFPIWAEAQLVAGQALAHVGQYQQAQHIAHQAREAKPGLDPEMWIGEITNPKNVHPFFGVVAGVAAEKYLDAYHAAESVLTLIDTEQPDNLQWRVHVTAMQARALFGLNDVSGATTLAAESWRNSVAINSLVNQARIEKLYHEMRKKSGKHAGVKSLGELIGVRIN
ncbi:MAG: hypothetical protein H0X24_05975 [Ktedonobacterales bacterium]|nr:hypothetical protein [Ktedonobacterales bacterium]